MGPNKGKSIFRKILNMTTFKFVKRCDCDNHITKNATLLDIWLDLFLKSVGKQVQGNMFEAHFNTRPTNISCSKMFLRNTMKMFYRTK